MVRPSCRFLLGLSWGHDRLVRLRRVGIADRRYIGSGSGQGNAYGLGAICAVTFPIAAFFRVHFPGPVLTAVMTPVTFGLVIGGFGIMMRTDGRLCTWMSKVGMKWTKR